MKQLLFTLSVLIALAATAIVAGALRRESRSTALAAGSASVRFVPTTTTMMIGPTPAPTIDIDVANIPSPPGLGGYTVGLSWNPAVATLNSLTDAGVFAGGQNVVICATPTITAGAAHASCATLPFAGTPGPGVAVGLTPVPLLHASFAPVGAGTSPLGLTAVIGLTPYVTALKDPNGTPIASTQTGGALVVQGAPVTLGGVDNDSQAIGQTSLVATRRSTGQWKLWWITIGVLGGAGAAVAGWYWYRRPTHRDYTSRP